jgi:RNA polymerase sigma-70 factor (ECF subfamily)
VTSPPDTGRRESAPGLDPESREWLRCLRADDSDRDPCIARLHDLLLRAARFEVARRRASFSYLRGDDLDDIAQHAADDALVSVLRRLPDFRGDSRFTTWAYKFALLEASVKLRKRSWQGRELPLEPDVWSLFASEDLSLSDAAEQAELLAAVRRLIDVLAARLNTTRGALYKTLHDARRKLRARLEQQGFSTMEDAT